MYRSPTVEERFTLITKEPLEQFQEGIENIYTCHNQYIGMNPTIHGNNVSILAIFPLIHAVSFRKKSYVVQKITAVNTY